MITPTRPLLLASGSPRRREILTTLGVPLVVRAVAVDESPKPGEPALAYLERIAGDKLQAAMDAARGGSFGGVLVADTTVIVDGAILGKPADVTEAAAMIRLLAGRGHEVATRFAIAAPEGEGSLRYAETVITKVVFRALSEDEIEGYARTGEGLDKAGAYAVQGIGAFAVARVEGSYANVVGLPACEVISALVRMGLVERFPL